MASLGLAISNEAPPSLFRIGFKFPVLANTIINGYWSGKAAVAVAGRLFVELEPSAVETDMGIIGFRAEFS